ncbi:WxL domain-containing protein [Enterococcus sp. LJL120]
MKVRTLSAAALLAVLGVATVAPVAASASGGSHSILNSGTVTVGAGTIDPGTDPIIDPEDPDKSIDPNNPDIETPTDDPGSIGMEYVSKLKFGTISVSGAAQKVPAAAFTGYTTEWVVNPDYDPADPTTGDEYIWQTTTTEVTRGNLVTWGDLTGENLGYNITAKLTTQFTQGTGATNPGAVLTGSSLTYTNPLIATRPDADDPTNTTGGLVPTSTFTLYNDGSQVTADPTLADAQTVVTAAEGQGGGKFTLEFGQSDTYSGSTSGTAGSSVNLNIPAATSANMAIGDYVAEITWTMNYTYNPTAP